MRAIILIAVLGAMGLSPFLWSGTAEADVRPPHVRDRCNELRLEIEDEDAPPLSTWPKERILLGLFCAFAGDPGQIPAVPAVPWPGIPPLDLDMSHQQVDNNFDH